MRLRKIETEMQDKFKGLNIFNSDAPEDYSNLSHEEKNKGKYMATFPFPYMNGHLHLGKFQKDVSYIFAQCRSCLHYVQG